MSIISLTSVVISTISTIIALIMLVLTRQDMNRREVKNQEMFVNDAYDNFQVLYTTFLQNPSLLKVIAKERGKKVEEIQQQALASLLINHAHNNFRLHSQQLIPPDLWECFQTDMKELFSWEFIRERWQAIEQLYPNAFQTFIHTEIISDSSSIKPNTMQLTVIHSTQNCADSSCPTIYINEEGNYVIQGFKVDPTKKVGLKLPQEEDMIEVPKAFLEGFVEKDTN